MTRMERRKGRRFRLRWLVAGALALAILLVGAVIARAAHTESHSLSLLVQGIQGLLANGADTSTKIVDLAVKFLCVEHTGKPTC